MSCATVVLMEGLTFEDVPRPAGVSWWRPFPEGAGDDYTPGWWTDAYHDDQWTAHVVRSRGQEVARVELDWGSNVDHYAGSEGFGPRPLLEIERLDVHRRYRRLGIGRGVVDLVVARNPDRRVFALAPEAGAFWEALGWERRLPVEEPAMPMFLAPLSAASDRPRSSHVEGECTPDGHSWKVSELHLSLKGNTMLVQQCRLCGVEALWSPPGD